MQLAPQVVSSIGLCLAEPIAMHLLMELLADVMATCYLQQSRQHRLEVSRLHDANSVAKGICISVDQCQ